MWQLAYTSLLLIITLRFTCGEKKIYSTIKKSQKIVNMIVAQLSIWRGGLGILDKDTQLNSLKRKWIQRSLNSTNALRKELTLYRLNLILDSKQGIGLFRQKQILSFNRTRIWKNRTMEIFLFSYLMLGYMSPITTFLSPRLQKKFLTNPYF